MPILWRNKMSVGNKIIDDEHKHLICLINSVEIALKADDHQDMVNFLLHQLHAYTHDHFVQEEKMMLLKHYEGYTEHKQEHEKILHGLKNVQKHVDQLFKSINHAKSRSPKKSHSGTIQWAQGDVTSPAHFNQNIENNHDTQVLKDIDSELIGLLKTWIIDHVLTTDQKLKTLFTTD